MPFWQVVATTSITMSITHICYGHNIIAKTVYYAVNITMIEAKLFAIRCGINQECYNSKILEWVKEKEPCIGWYKRTQ